MGTQARSATVRAKAHCSFFKVTKHQFDTIVDK
jgi:hypothetical protein